MANYKPNGYNSVSPYFIIEGTQKMVALLQDLFEAKTLRRYENPDGSIMHIELQLDDSVIMMGEASKEWPANKHLMHIYVTNVDIIYQKALALGCTPIEEPKIKDGDPDKRGSFLDFAGNMWSVATQQN